MTGALPSNTAEAQWRAAAEQALKNAGPGVLDGFDLGEGVIIGPVTGRRRGAALTPGRPAGERWSVAQRLDDPNTDRANRQALDDLEGGADTLIVVGAASPFARGFGLAGDPTAALAGVQRAMATLRLDAGPEAPEMATALLAQTTADALPLSICHDPIGARAAFGADAPEPEQAARQTARRFLTGPARVFAADVRVFHEAGAGPALELGLQLAQGLAYLKTLEACGLAPEAGRRRLDFVVALDGDVFTGLARCRALRLCWGRIEAACGLAPEPIRLHAETSWRMLTQRDQWSNLLRATCAGFAAALGGANTLCALPASSAAGLPDARARRITRNALHVLQDEAQLHRITDPAAGAGGLEALTDQLCSAGWRLFQMIERQGGLSAALASGWVQEKIAAQVASGGVIVGASQFTPAEAEAPGARADAPAPPRAPGAGALRRLRPAEAFETS